MQTKRSRLWRLLVVLILGIGATFLFVGHFSLPQPIVHAQTPLTITLDGDGSDWTDTAWRLMTGLGGNLSITVDTLCGGGSLGTNPNNSPCFARSGYDITDLWAYYQVGSNNWYFRLDVDSRPGDSDSRTGVAGNLGVGTDAFDTGALTNGDPDPAGVNSIAAQEEKYFLQFGPTAASLPAAVATLANDGGPNTLFTLTPPDSTLSGEAIYSTLFNPGVIEWRIDKDSLFPPGNPPQPDLWIRAFADSDFDRLGEDITQATLLLGIDLNNVCPTPTVVVGQTATFPITYTIRAASTYPVASTVVITAPVPAGTTYVSCSGGTSCSESGGLITWNLGTRPRGDTGVVSFDAVFNVTTGITTDAFITIAEGLRDQTRAAGCTATEPPPPPPPPPPDGGGGDGGGEGDGDGGDGDDGDGPPIPEPTTITLVGLGLAGLAGYAARQRAKRNEK